MEGDFGLGGFYFGNNTTALLLQCMVCKKALRETYTEAKKSRPGNERGINLRFEI